MGISVPVQFLKAACLCVLLITLTAGLWPFHAPRNDVGWLSAGNGVFLGKHGSLVSASPLSVADGMQASDACSLELWLKPNRIDAGGMGMILALYSPADKLTTLSVRQYQGGLVMERQSPHSMPEKTAIYVGEVFDGARPVLVTITSSGSGTDTYVDGVLKKAVPDFVVSRRDLTGRIVLGSAPSTSYNWSGDLKGLAFYDHALSPVEVSQSSSAWVAGSQPSVGSNAAFARYVFNEGKGRVVHNTVNAATNLLIPEHFFVLNEQFLERPWDEYRPDRRYWKDVLINIVGLIPLGFVFYAYFSATLNIRRAASLTIAFGFVVSLTIEVLQAFLPTRDSGMTDLFTNTLGTALGVALCTWCMTHNWFEIAGISSSARHKEQQEDASLIA